VPDPAEVVTLRAIPPSVSSSGIKGIFESSMSYPEYEDFRRSTRSFFGLTAMDHITAAFAKDAKTPTKYLLGNQLDGDIFRTMRIASQVGRAFTPEDDQPGREPVVVISDDLWRDEFNRDRSVIGRQILINNVPFTIIGVTPESFTGLDPFTRAMFYIPIAMAPRLYADLAALRTDRSRRSFVVKGRLNSGVSIAAAAREVAAIEQSLAETYPATNRGYRATVNTEFETKLVAVPVLGDLSAALFSIALLVLLIACANVANLMLSRGRVRAREIAVRLAIGASRGRLIRLLLIESVLIALAGGILAVFAARFAAGVFANIQIPSDLPMYLDTRVDAHVLWFTILLSTGSALVFGLVPAFESTRPDLLQIIKTGESDDPRRHPLGRSALVVVQIAGAMVLLVLTMQGRHNFNELLTSNIGFRRDHRISMRFDPQAAGYSAAQTAKFYERLVERAAEVTGVRSAAMASSLPMTYDPERLQIAPDHYDFPPGKEAARTMTYIVDEHYFDTLAVPILAGRGFRASDRDDAPRVVVVNQAFANEFLPGNPIGRRLKIGNAYRGTEIMAEVVGVVMTGKMFLLTEPPTQAIYLPLRQNFHERMTLVAETAGDPGPVAAPLQVARKTREIGIRMALGAERLQVVKLFLTQAVWISAVGIGTGLTLSGLANRLSASTLGTASLDPRLVAVVAVSLLLATTIAALIPARTASRIDPQQALRIE
jgi:predicted permease